MLGQVPGYLSLCHGIRVKFDVPSIEKNAIMQPSRHVTMIKIPKVEQGTSNICMFCYVRRDIQVPPGTPAAFRDIYH